MRLALTKGDKIMATYLRYTDRNGREISARVVTMRDGIAVMDNGRELVLCDVGWLGAWWGDALECFSGTDKVLASVWGKARRRVYAYMSRR